MGHYIVGDGSCVEVGGSRQYDRTRGICTASDLASRDIVHVGNVDSSIHWDVVSYLLGRE